MSKCGFGKFVAGVAVGVGIGVLFAPKSGSETREELKLKMDELIEKAKKIKKEDVKEKKEVNLSSYTRGRVSVDDIRNKAYGEKEEVESKVEVDEEEENLMVDLSDKAKPEVKEITVGDALEYFQELSGTSPLPFRSFPSSRLF